MRGAVEGCAALELDDWVETMVMDLTGFSSPEPCLRSDSLFYLSPLYSPRAVKCSIGARLAGVLEGLGSHRRSRAYGT